MSQLFCRLCLFKRNEYFTINQDFREKILKHLNLDLNFISENILICNLCTERIDTFGQYYDEIHKNQQKLEEQQEVEVRNYIILLRDNKSDEVQIKEVNEDDELMIAPVPEVAAYEESEETVEVCQLMEDEESKAPPCKSVLTQDECQVVSTEGFPKNILNEGKLLIRGKELSQLIARFYRLECSLCSNIKKFKKLSAMNNHFKNEHSTKGFVSCCGLKIVKIRQIAMHMARHLQPEAFQCPICQKLLTCPKILQYHIQNHLPEEERTLACTEPGCHRRFSYQSALTTHSVSHLPESERTSFGCETCGRKFSTARKLSSHVDMVHTKNHAKKEFECEICSKKFLCKSNLSYHLTTHKNLEFQVECSLCKKFLKNKICLRKHVNTIHSEVRHFCDICDYSAANKQCLANHKKVQHSDKKPFECEFCLKTFKLKNTLTNHVNAHHNGIRKYSCEFCTKTFVSSGNYYSHRKRMHPQELSKKLQEKELNDQRRRIEIQTKS